MLTVPSVRLESVVAGQAPSARVDDPAAEQRRDGPGLAQASADLCGGLLRGAEGVVGEQHEVAGVAGADRAPPVGARGKGFADATNPDNAGIAKGQDGVLEKINKIIGDVSSDERSQIWNDCSNRQPS